MSWLTRADLENRFGMDAITELETGGASVALAMADAEAETESYLAQVVPLPIITVPDTVKRIAAMIARYNLWRRDLPEDHPVVIAYKGVLKELSDIAAGRVSLPLSGGTAEATSTGAVLVSSSRVFTDDLMAGSAL